MALELTDGVIEGMAAAMRGERSGVNKNICRTWQDNLPFYEGDIGLLGPRRSLRVLRSREGNDVEFLCRHGDDIAAIGADRREGVLRRAAAIIEWDISPLEGCLLDAIASAADGTRALTGLGGVGRGHGVILYGVRGGKAEDEVFPAEVGAKL